MRCCKKQGSGCLALRDVRLRSRASTTYKMEEYSYFTNKINLQMKNFLLRSKYMFLVLTIVLGHSAFASVESINLYTSYNLKSSLPHSGIAIPIVKKPPLGKLFINVINDKIRKGGKGSVAVVVIVAVLLSLLLGFGIFLFAWVEHLEHC